jgi:SAM-dependent methyltransferase
VSSGSTVAVLRALRPKYYVKGVEWRDGLPAEELEACAELGIEVVYLDTKRDSSSALVDSLVARMNGAAPTPDTAAVARFEDVVLAQRAIDSRHYDEDYFVSEWRDAGNSYDLETRRGIEGRHPALIREVFEPDRVLDLGCGPGALIYLLHELGVNVDGVDFSAASRELAHDDVRDRITIGTVTDPPVEEQAYDLVICREVVEHLTVLQVRRTVSALCRASSRYVYVTTRFHPEPADLLDVTTQFDVDPTHITLLNKEFLRCLLVLEGFRRRADLEQRMDWGGKDRVLVYERVPTA